MKAKKDKRERFRNDRKTSLYWSEEKEFNYEPESVMNPAHVKVLVKASNKSKNKDKIT